ncbi:MAG: spermidine/putrescine ABC transporter permease PotC [Desulfobacteraceae bacterium IS3]|nr:MAG: spermidine/putrescine ABC transporter permease PotC [Desulfobacteraceae bacterium IS3]HAO19743.1 spermidine/putrescine ABC transporter permease PotC [Desulfobacteraceae bacterium]
MKKWLKIAYITAVFMLLYLPTLVLVIYSFNDSKISTNWQGFTIRWYFDFFQDSLLLDAMLNSLIVAIISGTVATVIGTLGAVAFYRYRFIGRKALYSLIYIVMMSPDIVMGISLLLFFMIIGMPIGFLTLVLSHITFCLPFVVVTVYARISGFDRNIIEAAKDLGADEFQTFRHIILPMLMPAIISGWLLSFTLSIDDCIVSFFVTGPSFEVLPLKIYSMVRLGVKPEINALSTIVFVLTLISVSISQLLIREEKQ